MSRKSIDVTGKTIDEAKTNALSQLGLSEDEVSIEVLDRGKQGLFGLFGASPAKIRVSYGLEEEPVPAPKPARRTKPPTKPRTKTTSGRRRPRRWNPRPPRLCRQCVRNV